MTTIPTILITETRQHFQLHNAERHVIIHTTTLIFSDSFAFFLTQTQNSELAGDNRC
jgi:hypothetical protein